MYHQGKLMLSSLHLAFKKPERYRIMEKPSEQDKVLGGSTTQKFHVQQITARVREEEVYICVCVWKETAREKQFPLKSIYKGITIASTKNSNYTWFHKKYCDILKTQKAF